MQDKVMINSISRPDTGPTERQTDKHIHLDPGIWPN